MDVVFLAGPIASGKSTVAAELQELGAWRIDLDRASRAVTVPGSPCLAELAAEFGEDIVREDGSLDRARLAAYAFASAEATRRLEAIEHPHIRRALVDSLSQAATLAEEGDCVLVEVPLLDKVEDLLPMADAVVYVHCPFEKRLALARERGVAEADFRARDARQPSEAYLRAHATDVIANEGSEDDLKRAARAWWTARYGEAPEE